MQTLELQMPRPFRTSCFSFFSLRFSLTVLPDFFDATFGGTCLPSVPPFCPASYCHSESTKTLEGGDRVGQARNHDEANGAKEYFLILGPISHLTAPTGGGRQAPEP